MNSDHEQQGEGFIGSTVKRIEVLTLFPELFAVLREHGVIARALRQGCIHLESIALRSYGLGVHRSVDDAPYGGGAGMVLRPEPLACALDARRSFHEQQGRRLRRIMLRPQGKRFTQEDAERWAKTQEVLLFICGRYEGIDERIRMGWCDEEISLGDFVCMGGEAPAWVMIEAIARLVPQVLGNPASAQEESFRGGYLEHPHYTRPAEFRGLRVPEVLRSGNHARIQAWRKEHSFVR